MSDDQISIDRIEKVTGKDGATAWYVEGGKQGQKGSFYIHPESFAAEEKKGRKALEETLKRSIETTLQSAKEPR